MGVLLVPISIQLTPLTPLTVETSQLEGSPTCSSADLLSQVLMPKGGTNTRPCGHSKKMGKQLAGTMSHECQHVEHFPTTGQAPRKVEIQSHDMAAVATATVLHSVEIA